MMMVEGLELQRIGSDRQKSPEALGFSNGKTGGHMARSMMLTVITKGLQALPEVAGSKEFKKATEKENCLGMPTFSSRNKSYRHLVELNGLDPKKALFRVLRKGAKAANKNREREQPDQKTGAL